MNNNELVYKSPKRPALTAIWALSVSSIFIAVCICFKVIAIYLLQQIQHGEDVDSDFLALAVAGADLSELILLISSIIVGISFLYFIYRTSKNSWFFAKKKLKFTPGRAVISYFIPIFSFFWCYQSINEIWRESYPAGVNSEAHSDTIKKRYILLWWVIFNVNSITYNLSQRIWRKEVEQYENLMALDYQLLPDNLQDMLFVTNLEIISDLASLITCGLGIFIIYAIYQRQEKKYTQPTIPVAT